MRRSPGGVVKLSLIVKKTYQTVVQETGGCPQGESRGETTPHLCNRSKSLIEDATPRFFSSFLSHCYENIPDNRPTKPGESYWEKVVEKHLIYVIASYLSHCYENVLDSRLGNRGNPTGLPNNTKEMITKTNLANRKQSQLGNENKTLISKTGNICSARVIGVD